MYLLDSWLSLVSNDLIISLLSSAATLVGSYFILRERVVKLEIKNQHTIEYIDNQISLLRGEIENIKDDISDFKELNKETTKSLIENTTAIRELKLVLELLREQIKIQQAQIKNLGDD